MEDSQKISAKYEYEVIPQDKEKAESAPYIGYGKRHNQIILLFLCVTSSCFCRACLSIAILGMTDTTNPNKNIQTFDWSKSTQGFVLSAMGWGEIVIQLPGGFLACKYGGKNFVSASIISAGVFSLLTPAASYIGSWQGVCFVRMCMGLTMGLLSLATQVLLGAWIPVLERNLLGNIVYCGLPIAIILCMPISAYIAGSSYGWPYIFYFFGCISLFAGCVWIWVGTNSPAEHSTISPEERAFIEKSVGSEDNKGDKKIPWRAILTSRPVWALILTQTGALYGYTVMLTETPSFFKLALGIELQDSGLLAALPYIASLFMTLLASWSADILLNKGYLSLTVIRKLFNTIGTWGPAITLIALIYVPVGNVTTAVTFIITILAFDAITAAGFMLNGIDLSPNYVGIIVSISFTMADLACAFAPIVSGLILKDPTDISQWKTVFLITSGSYFFGNVFFLIFGSAEEEPWSVLLKRQDNNEETLMKEEALLPAKKNDGKNYRIKSP